MKRALSQTIVPSGRLTEEQVVCVWAKAPNPENLKQVKELSMNIPHHSDRCFDMNDVALLHEQFLGLGADGLDDRLSQELLSVKSFDTFVQVDSGCEDC